MRNACDQLYRNWAMLQPRDLAYHTCILDSLGDVKDTYAVQQLAAACSRQSEGAGPTFKSRENGDFGLSPARNRPPCRRGDGPPTPGS